MAQKGNKGNKDGTLITSYLLRRPGLQEPKTSVLKVLSDRFGHTKFKSELQGQAVEATCQGKAPGVCVFLVADTQIVYVPLSQNGPASYAIDLHVGSSSCSWLNLVNCDQESVSVYMYVFHTVYTDFLHFLIN